MRFTPLSKPTPPPYEPEPDSIEKRLIRIETKLSKLLNHFGLTANGQPVADHPTYSPKDHYK